MTPKDKTRDIANKFLRKVVGKSISNEAAFESAKQCSLICVNEIINELIDYGRHTGELQNMDRILEYWEKVKYEIEKL